MIVIDGQQYALDDPLVLAAVAGVIVVLLLLVFGFLSVRSAGRSARALQPLAQQLGMLGSRVQALSDGQERLSGGLNHVSEAQAQSQTAMLQLM
ncbi:MAG: DNA recombination protein RmuC, partial [Pseudomonadota bacterium]